MRWEFLLINKSSIPYFAFTLLLAFGPTTVSSVALLVCTLTCVMLVRPHFLIPHLQVPLGGLEVAQISSRLDQARLHHRNN